MKKLLKAFCMSFSMFCAIPTPFAHVWEDSVRSLMLVVFPFVGTVIGAIWAGAGVLMRYFGCPHLFAAAILLFCRTGSAEEFILMGLWIAVTPCFPAVLLKKSGRYLKIPTSVLLP